jgi:hypothetical protein
MNTEIQNHLHIIDDKTGIILNFKLSKFDYFFYYIL